MRLKKQNFKNRSKKILVFWSNLWTEYRHLTQDAILKIWTEILSIWRKFLHILLQFTYLKFLRCWTCSFVAAQKHLSLGLGQQHIPQVPSESTNEMLFLIAMNTYKIKHCELCLKHSAYCFTLFLNTTLKSMFKWF